MEWLSLLLAAVLFAAACNLDTVILSMGYAVKGVRVSLSHSLIIAALTTLITWASLLLGAGAARVLSGPLPNLLGGLVLVGIGAWFVLDWLRRLGPAGEAEGENRAATLWGCGSLAAARAVGAIRERSPIPLVADIHFDYRLALECVAAGCDKVRINPGNIGGEDRVKAVADACRQKGIPIRIGVNGGSLEKPILAKYGGVTPEALVESAFGHIRLLEKFDFTDICVSLKSSSVRTTMAAYRLMNRESDYPLHLGVTETGTLRMGTLKSAVGIGGLLAMGIGDTMRVSLSADPVEEVYAARDILKAAGVRKEGPELVSCPTCGRTRIDLIGLATQVEERLKAVDKPITVAVMGCVVNGPGEASAADVGIAGGNGEGLLFRKGEIVKKVPQEALVDELFALIEEL